MAQIIQTGTFNINTTVNITQGEKIVVKLKLDNITAGLNGNFTASLAGPGELKIASLASSTGFQPTELQFIHTASMADPNNTDEIVFSEALTTFYGENKYIFVPNTTGNGLKVSSLYETYGDVDYPFYSGIFDIILVYLEDGTYIEARVLSATVVDGKLRLKIDTKLSKTLRDSLRWQTYQRVLLLSRRKDETNVILNFTKRDGKTSYGFLIPEDISDDILDNIDTITREVKQKLLNDQSIVNSLDGGNFG